MDQAFVCGQEQHKLRRPPYPFQGTIRHREVRMRLILLSLLAISCVAPEKRSGAAVEEVDTGVLEAEPNADTGVGEDPEPRERACGDVLTASGQFEFDGKSLTIDGSQNTGLIFSTRHKTGADSQDAGCMSDITVDIQLDENGCRLQAHYAAAGNGDFDLSTLTFEADFYCPNFDDDLEGVYASVEVLPTSTSNIPNQLPLETGTETEVCIEDIDYRLVSTGFVYREDTAVSHPFRLDIQMRGDHWSTGSDQAVCGPYLDERANEDDDGVEEPARPLGCVYRDPDAGAPFLCLAPTGDAFSSMSAVDVCAQFDDIYADQLGPFTPSEPVDVCPESYMGACAIDPGEGQDQVWFFYVSGGDTACDSSGGTWSTP